MERLSTPVKAVLALATGSLCLSAYSLVSVDSDAETLPSDKPRPQATISPQPTPEVTPGAQAPAPRPEDPNIAMQRELNSIFVPLGMPKLELDGKVGPQTKRALCAARLLTGQEASKDKPSKAEMRSLPRREQLSFELTGLVISRTCQVLVVNLEDEISMVIPVSTGMPGRTTPAVDSKIQYGRYGWHNSTLWPDAGSNGNMYFPLYFNGAIAVHGSRAMHPSVTTPRSHGCVRVTQDDAKKLWKLADGPTQGRKDQYVKGLKPLPVHVI